MSPGATATLPPDATGAPGERPLRPVWLRPAALVVALGLHGAAAGFVVVRSAPPSPIDAIEVTLVAEGDAAETRQARDETTPAEATSAPPPAPAPFVAAAPPPPPAAAAPALAAPAPLVEAPEAPPLRLATPEPTPVATPLEPAAVKPPVDAKPPEVVAQRAERPTPAALREQRRLAAERRRTAQAAEQAARLGAEQARAETTVASRAAYASLLAAELNRHKLYPSSARAAGVTGSVGVAFTIGAAGGVVEHRITRSSGSAALDGAVEAMMAAVQAPPPPGGSFHTSTIVNFTLR